VYQELVWTADEHRLVIPENNHRQLLTFQQNSSSAPESGGVLLGRRILGTPDCIVDEVTSPMAGDIQNRYFFFRGQGHQSRQVDYWIETAKTGQILGGWHTHPEADPTPSRTDIRDWKAIIKKCAPLNKPLFFLIIGQQHIRVWTGFKRRLKPPQIFPCNNPGDLL